METTYSLYSLLNQYEVVIPMIQRDYAQGRKDKDYIRRAFLDQIKRSIDSGTPSSLDFIYGNVEGDNRFFPLDGQQRLTTLWLITWYVSWKAGYLNEDKQWLKKFSYETRASSHEFCDALCEKMIGIKLGETDKLASYIKEQTWFYSSWLQDPTISAMLRTFSGEDGSSDDCIEGVFKDDGSSFNKYRENLMNKTISFELMVIGSDKLPVSDDLYIKMNARGKILTDFENFKADLVAWMQSNDNTDGEQFKGNNDAGIMYMHYFPMQIDNAWTDVFWKSARDDLKEGYFKGKIDKAFFAFFNRFVLNDICCNSEMSAAEFEAGKEREDHKEEKATFEKLREEGSYGSHENGDAVLYDGFDRYKDYLTFECLKRLDGLFTAFQESKKEIANVLIEVSNGNDSVCNTSFIPRYNNNNDELAAIDLKDRVYNLAVCRFLDNCSASCVFERQKFKKWMRVVRNIVENAAIDSIPDMVNCMRSINDIATKMEGHTNDVYLCLKNYSLEDDSGSATQLKRQINEEIEKAKKISDDPTLEEKIIKAENHAFFNGAIRFLYTNDRGEVDWKCFDKKYETATSLFDGKDVNVETIKKLLAQFSSFDDINEKFVFTSLGYDNRKHCWKNDILLNNDLIKIVHNLLMHEDTPTHDRVYDSFLKSGLIKFIIEKSDNYKYRYHWHHYYMIHKEYSSTEGVYVHEGRSEKCQELKKLSDKGEITILDNEYIGGYYWGVYVSFILDNREYRWFTKLENNELKDKIYLHTSDGEDKEPLTWNDSDSLIDCIRESNGG